MRLLSLHSVFLCFVSWFVFLCVSFADDVGWYRYVHLIVGFVCSCVVCGISIFMVFTFVLYSCVFVECFGCLFCV